MEIRSPSGTHARLGVAGLVSLAAMAMAAPASPADAAQQYTTIKIQTDVAADGATVVAERGAPWHSTQWTSDATVVNGRAWLRVPTAQTKGLTFTLRYPADFMWQWGTDAEVTGYHTYAVFRYKGKATGDPVPSDEVATFEKGLMCWKGTTKKSVTIRLGILQTQTTFDTLGHEGNYTQLALYADPTLKAVGEYAATSDGSLKDAEPTCFTP